MLEKILTSRTRTRILTLFLLNPDEELFVREICRKISENINAVRRELSNLEDLGFLKSEKKGNMKYYSVNKKFPIYPELKSIVLKAEGVSMILKDILKREEGIKLAFIYGSFASGEERKGSDLDLFLVGDADEDEIIKNLFQVEERLSREINYALFSEEEFHKRQKEDDPFIKNVLKEPRIIIKGKID